mgnify:CR=1 FL=1
MNTKQLRQTILDLAIRGELVPQDPTDEPASVLLERIRAEKEQLIKDKKLKRDKKDNEPIDEVPFELPEGWEWCRLGEIGIWGSGITPSRNKKEYYDGNIPWLKTGDLNDSYIYETSELISDLAVKEYSLKKIPIGSILIAMYGATIAKLGLLEIEVTTNQACCACTPFSGIVNKFLFHYLFSQKQNIKNKAEGGAQPNISKEKLINFLFPLPPLAEQHRIVEKIEQLFALVDTIETHKEQLKSDVKQAKNQVLSDAIAGKLTHQDPNDEPAEALLKRIGKTTATAADTPYEKLPKGWAWCRLGDIANIISGVSYNKKDISDNGIRILRGGNIQNSKVLILEDDIFISENYKNETNSVKIGDIVIVASTGSNLLIGKAGFIKKDLDNTQIGAFLRIIRPISDICSFLQLIFISDFYKTYIRDLAKGTNINNIKNEYLTEFIIPLPPLAEQHRIVKKIETFFASFDQIEKMLT